MSALQDVRQTPRVLPADFRRQKKEAGALLKGPAR